MGWLETDRRQSESLQSSGRRYELWLTICKIWQMRLPAYVNMDPNPYDPILYRAGLEPVAENEDNNVKRSKMISVRNTMRWKWVTGDDGKPVCLHPDELPRNTSLTLYQETPEQFTLSSMVRRLSVPATRFRLVRPRSFIRYHSSATYGPTTQEPSTG